MIAGGVALVGLSPAVTLGQTGDGAPVGTTVDAPKPPPVGQAQPGSAAAEPPFDPIAERIKYLHSRLRITAAQEALWAPLARVIRENGRALTPFINERARNAKNDNALDFLHSYERLGVTQLDGLKKFATAFEPLYNSFSDEQKKTADTLFRLGPISLIGGIPQLAEELITPVPYDYAYYSSYSVAPALPLFPFGRFGWYPHYLLRPHGVLRIPVPPAIYPRQPIVPYYSRGH